MDLEENNQHQNPERVEVDISYLERKFVNLYRKLKLLWDPHHPDYNNRYKRNTAYDALLPIYRRIMPKATRFHIRQKINILRSSYRKDLRKYLASRTVTSEGKVVNTYIPSSWKFRALSFLNSDEKNQEDSNKSEAENSITEEDSSPELYEEEELELEFVSDSHLDANSANDEPYTLSIPGSTIYIKDEKSKKDCNSHNMNYNSEENLLEQEYNAISSNVSCKLQRMKPQQRYRAELLINKVLIYGLNERLTDDTDLTDVWQIDETE